MKDKKLKFTNKKFSHLEDDEIQSVFDKVPPEMEDEPDISEEKDDNNIEEEMSVPEVEYFNAGTQPLVLGGNSFAPGSAISEASVKNAPSSGFLLKYGHISTRNKS